MKKKDSLPKQPNRLKDKSLDYLIMPIQRDLKPILLNYSEKKKTNKKPNNNEIIQD